MNIAGFRNLSLRSQITMVVLTFVLIASVVLYYLLDQRQHERLLSTHGSTVINTVQNRGTRLQVYIEKLRKDALFLSRTPPVQGIIRAKKNSGIDPLDGDSSELWQQRLQHIFSAFLHANSDYYQVRYIGIDSNGGELVRVDRKNDQVKPVHAQLLQKKGARDYFKAARQFKGDTVYLSEINLNREWGAVVKPHRQTIRAVVTVDDENGDPFGLLVINMDVGNYLDEVMQSLPDGVIGFITNQKGDFLAHPNPTRSYGFDLQQRYRWQDEMPKLEIQNPDQQLASHSGLNASKDNNPRTTAQSIKLQKILRFGEAHYMAAGKIRFDPDQPSRYLSLIYGFSEQVITQEMEPFRRIMILAVAGLTLLIALLVFISVRRMFEPLEHLTIGANLIADGHYETKLPRRASGELGVFVAAFKGMLTRIRKREKEILQLNENLKKSEQMANLIIDTAPQAIVVVDSNGHILRVNNNASAFFGYEPDEMLGEQVEILIPEKYRGHHGELRESYAKGAQTRKVGRALTGLRKDGSEFPVEIALGPMFIGKELHIIVSINDLTERIQLENQLQVAQKMEAVGELAAGIAHEINTPLQYVGDNVRFVQNSFTELNQLIAFYRKEIEQLPLDERQKKKISTAEESADLEFLLEDIPHALTQSLSGIDGASAIVQAMKEFSHPGAKELGNLDLNRILTNTAMVSKNEWKYVADLNMELDKNLPMVMCLPEINQVFLNIIVNAAHAIEEKLGDDVSEKGEIRVQTRQLPDTVEIRISDTGTGIAEKKLNRIFDPFYTTKDVGKGTGQGLSISYNIVVERLGGSIHVDSEEGKGSTFIITIPVSQKKVTPETSNE